MAHIEDINVEERVQNGQHKIKGTDEGYANYINQFCNFLHSEEHYIPGQKMISHTLLTDHNIAGFIFHLADLNDHRPHFLKGLQAGLGYALKRNSLPNIHDFVHLYPLTHSAIDVSSK